MNEEAFLDPKQVFLNSPPPLPGTAGLHRTQTDKAKVEEIEFLSARIQGHTFWENRWGTGARCLHLSNIDLNSIRINNITSKDSHAGLGELRVLILTSKWKIDQGVPAWLWTLNDDSFDAGRAGKPVEDKPPRAGYKIIHEILEQSLEDLRLLSIDGRNFLIEVSKLCVLLQWPLMMSAARTRPYRESEKGIEGTFSQARYTYGKGSEMPSLRGYHGSGLGRQ